MPSISATYGFLQVPVRNVKKYTFFQKIEPVTNCIHDTFPHVLLQQEQQKINGKLNSKISTYNEGTSCNS